MLRQQRSLVGDSKPLAAMMGIGDAGQCALMKTDRRNIIRRFIQNERRLAAIDDTVALGPGPHRLTILEVRAQRGHDRLAAVAYRAVGEDCHRIRMMNGSD